MDRPKENPERGEVGGFATISQSISGTNKKSQDLNLEPKRPRAKNKRWTKCHQAQKEEEFAYNKVLLKLGQEIDSRNFNKMKLIANADERSAFEIEIKH